MTLNLQQFEDVSDQSRSASMSVLRLCGLGFVRRAKIFNASGTEVTTSGSLFPTARTSSPQSPVQIPWSADDA